jgi:hypothetical protein
MKIECLKFKFYSIMISIDLKIIDTQRQNSREEIDALEYQIDMCQSSVLVHSTNENISLHFFELSFSS